MPPGGVGATGGLRGGVGIDPGGLTDGGALCIAAFSFDRIVFILLMKLPHNAGKHIDNLRRKCNVL